MSPITDAACFQRAAVVDRDMGLSVATRHMHPGGRKVAAASPGLARHGYGVSTLSDTVTFHAATSGRLAVKSFAAPVQGRQSACAPARNWYKFIVEYSTIALFLSGDGPSCGLSGA